MYGKYLGRWGVVDPLSEAMPDYSPYSYAFNNPVKFVDVFGMAPESRIRIDEKGGPYISPEEGRAQAEDERQRNGGTPRLTAAGNSSSTSPGMAICPTCPNTPEYKDYRDDPNNIYCYDLESKIVTNDPVGAIVVHGEDTSPKLNQQLSLVVHLKKMNNHYA